MDKIQEQNLTRKGAGRPKGSPNRVGKAAKEVIQQAATELGGAERLLTWVQEDPANERAFWAQIYPKLLPLTVSGDPENPINHNLSVVFVKPHGQTA